MDKFLKGLCLVCALCALIFSCDVFAETIGVTSFEQETPMTDDGDCTLAEAIEAANTNLTVDACPAGSVIGTDTLTLDPGTFTLTQASSSSFGLPMISSQITIAGQGPSFADSIIQRGPASSTNFGIFQIGSGGNLTLTNIRISEAADQPAISNAGTLVLDSVQVYQNYGGGIYNDTGGILTITDSSIIENSRTGPGGGICNFGTTTITNTEIAVNTSAGNSSSGIGGGLYSGQSTQVTITDSVFLGNYANHGGGGIYFYQGLSSGSLNIDNTVIHGNHTNSTINPPSKGGGLRVQYPAAANISFSNSVVINDTTFSENTANLGGGVYGYGVFTRVSFKSNLANQPSGLGKGGAFYIHGPSSNFVMASFVNSTFFDNHSTGLGGAIYQQQGRGVTNHVTIANNVARQGGGIFRSASAEPLYSSFSIASSLIDVNTAVMNDPDCSGTLVSNGANLIGSTTGCTIPPNTADAFDVPANLLALINSTTPGRTVIPISSDSPARDTGDAYLSSMDQRLVACFGPCDTGSYEFSCGDGEIQNPAEACDDSNETNDDDCSNACLNALCGDSIVQTSNGETCDDGNTQSNDLCSSSCQIEICGDGTIQSPLGEQCDDGDTDNDDGCSSTCQLETICGDNVVEVPEGCDDGNLTSGDGCSEICVVEVCGDGVMQTGIGEECDDGDTDSFDGCGPTCAIEVCGDGILNSTPPTRYETCDDGNTTSNDGCNENCQNEFCGDNALQTGIGEQCDDWNTTSNDGCSSTCQNEVCGDGIIQTSEQCDDSNTVNNDGCSSICMTESVPEPTPEDVEPAPEVVEPTPEEEPAPEVEPIPEAASVPPLESAEDTTALPPEEDSAAASPLAGGPSADVPEDTEDTTPPISDETTLDSEDSEVATPSAGETPDEFSDAIAEAISSSGGCSLVTTSRQTTASLWLPLSMLLFVISMLRFTSRSK